MRFSTTWLESLAPHLTSLVLAAGALAGCGAYVLWPVEPWFTAGLGAMLAAAVTVWLARGVAFLRLPAYFLLAAGAFFVWTQWNVQESAAFNWQLAGNRAHWVDGTITEIRDSPTTETRRTLVLENTTFYAAGRAYKPEMIRVSVYASQLEQIVVGDSVAVRMVAFAPTAPRFAGERDYRLYRFVKPGNLVGYAQGRLEKTHVDPQPGNWLTKLKERVKTETTPYAEGVLTALLVADQRQIPYEVREEYRTAGLSHLLAVSGLQLSLVGIGVFWLVRRLLVLWPAFGLRVNGKAAGAVAGLLAAAAYAVLAGAPVSVQRALIMVALLLFAVLLGRLRSLPRAWAVAVVVVLAINPLAIISAGFQLSFAAVLGLILLGLATGHPQGILQKAHWLARSSVVAAWATAPIILAQFGQVNVLGIFANLLAIPAMAPVTFLAFAGLVVMPLGLAAPLFWLAGIGAGWVNLWAGWIANVPLASITLPPNWWPLLMMMAVAMLAAIFSRVRGASAVAAAVLVGLGVAGYAWTAQGPQLVVMDGGNTALLREGGTTRRLWGDDDYLLFRWQQQTGVKLEGEIAARCDGHGCVYPTPLGPVVRLTHGASAEDCREAALIISAQQGRCPEKSLHEGAFAHATWSGGSRLSKQLFACARPWQKVASACW